MNGLNWIVLSMNRPFKVARIAGYLFVFLLSLYPTNPLSASNDTPNAKAKIAKVRVGYLPMVSSITYFVATERGYFTDQRLDVEANPIRTSDSVAQDLTSGFIDFAIELSIVPLLQTLVVGETPKFKIFSISRIVDGSAFDGVIAKASGGIKELRDLSGRTIAVFPGSTAKASFAAIFQQKYPDLPPPVFDNSIKPADQLNALARDDVAAIHAYEPIFTIGQKRFGFKPVFGSIYAAQLSPNPIGVAAVNAAFAEANKDTTVRFLHAMDQAVRYINDHPAEARDILARFTRADADIAREMQIMPMSSSKRIDKENLDHYLKILFGLQLYNTATSAENICLDL